MNIHTLLKNIGVKNTKLFNISSDKINVAGVNFYDKVYTYGKNKTTVNEEQLKSFLKACKPVRLNHIGVGYVVKNIETELEVIKKGVKGYKIFEEPNTSKKTRWFFIGNTSKNISSMFEIVLFEQKTKSKKPTLWKPHFQIDYDTSLDYKELTNLSIKFFGKNIFTYIIDIPKYGVVLAMGSVGKINNVSIMLGMGTKLRNTKQHRENIVPII